MMPRLFTNFSSQIQKGAVLDLLISRSIVEAHGGKIWAENIKNEKQATIAF